MTNVIAFPTHAAATHADDEEAPLARTRFLAVFYAKALDAIRNDEGAARWLGSQLSPLVALLEARIGRSLEDDGAGEAAEPVPASPTTWGDLEEADQAIPDAPGLPPGVAARPPSIPNKCCRCGTVVMAYGRGVRVLCETCRPINAQISALRSAAKRAAAVGASTTAYEELIARLDAQRPHPNADGTPS